MYRTLTWAILQRRLDPETQTDKIITLLSEIDIRYELRDGALVLVFNGEPVVPAAIRQPEVTAWVSQVSKIAAVRDWMVERQRQSAAFGLIVMEGRDIGTVVFSQARWKFYLIASAEERARRRLAQAGETTADATLASVAAEIVHRDHQDSTRKISPLTPAADAIQIDTTALSIEEVLDRILSIIRQGE